ncbi:MAG: amino acid--tRNA ligase-related protein, partial [Actinomycetota bacterium]
WEDTMSLVEDLVRATALAVNGNLELTLGDTKVDLSQPFPRITMFEAIEQALDDNLEETWRNGDVEGLRASADRHGVKIDPKWGPGKILVEIFEQRCEKDFVAPTFICGFPKEVSPLAKDHRTIPNFTEQADLLIDGLEIAPIYSELNDPEEQRRRFEQQAAARAAGDEEAQLPDEDFLEALSYGMPPAGGFGFGVDRMLAILTGAPSLREIILFPTLRPE